MTGATELFTCERQSMRLTARGCSRLWLSAQEKDNQPKPWEGRAACVTCPIGAMNSGQQISPVAESVALLQKICARCLRQGDRIIQGRLCVSCYNRQAEADKGSNAKGGKPRLCARLREYEVAVARGDEIEIVHRGRVTGATEIIMCLARRAEVATSFGWAAAGPGNIVGVLA